GEHDGDVVGEASLRAADVARRVVQDEPARAAAGGVRGVDVELARGQGGAGAAQGERVAAADRGLAAVVAGAGEGDTAGELRRGERGGEIAARPADHAGDDQVVGRPGDERVVDGEGPRHVGAQVQVAADGDRRRRAGRRAEGVDRHVIAHHQDVVPGGDA